MYADKQTEAIKGALDETNRRRTIQLAYNEEHGTKPISITKGVSDIAEFLALEQPHVPSSRRRRGDKVEGMTREELEKLVVTLEEEMFQAAEELRFEYAAKLRDEIKELRRELLALAEAPDCAGMSLGFVLAILVSGFITGGAGAARDPGAGPDADLADARDRAHRLDRRRRRRPRDLGDNGYVVSFLSFGVAIALVAAYRRFVQKRPIFGPGASRSRSAASASSSSASGCRSSGSTRTRCGPTRAARARAARGDAAGAAPGRPARRRGARRQARGARRALSGLTVAREGLKSAREAAGRREPPVVVAPDVGLDGQRAFVGAVDDARRAPRRGAAAAAGRGPGRSRRPRRARRR